MNNKQSLINKTKPLFGVVALCVHLQASLHANPTLRTKCSTSSRTTSPPPPHPLSSFHPLTIAYTHVTYIYYKQKTTLALWKHSLVRNKYVEKLFEIGNEKKSFDYSTCAVRSCMDRNARPVQSHVCAKLPHVPLL
jgi:hypothetical protein